MPILAATKLETIRQTARAYQVTPRTVYRWQRDGVNLSDPCSVALHLSTQKTPSPAAVAAVRKLLSTELETLNS
jgi:hypothetical protein